MSVLKEEKMEVKVMWVSLIQELDSCLTHYFFLVHPETAGVFLKAMQNQEPPEAGDCFHSMLHSWQGNCLCHRHFHSVYQARQKTLSRQFATPRIHFLFPNVLLIEARIV